MIVDVNVSLGTWPFQKFALNTPGQLARYLKKEGISAAWVSAIDSVLYPDPDVYDETLFQKLRRHKSLRFVKTVNPTLANWRDSLEQWVKERGIHAVKLFPNYHQYSLKDERVSEMMTAARAHRLVAFVQMRLEDERSHYPLMQVPGVACEEVIHLARAFPRVSFIVLCAYLAEAGPLTRAGRNLHVDLSFMETVDTLKTALKNVPAGQILFGSHTPFLNTRSALMKLELARAGRRQLRMISSGNAARVLRG